MTDDELARLTDQFASLALPDGEAARFLAGVQRHSVIAGHPDALAKLGPDRPEWRGVRFVPIVWADRRTLYTGSAFVDWPPDRRP